MNKIMRDYLKYCMIINNEQYAQNNPECIKEMNSGLRINLNL